MTLPPCLLEGAKLLFPTLDFSRIYFYYEQNAVSPSTITYLTRTEITLNGTSPDWPDTSEFKETFIVICHELTHALQKQTLWKRIIKTTTSLSSGLLYGKGKSATLNCIEHEAYAYEDKLLEWMRTNGVGSPCTFGASLPQIVFNQRGFNKAFADALKRDPSIIKHSSEDCSPWSILGPGAIKVFFGVILNIFTAILAIPAAFSEGILGYIVGIVGGFSGGAIGASLGAGLGSTISGSIGLGLIGGIIGIIIGSIVGALVGNIIYWLGRMFGNEGGAINLMFSNNCGLTFHSKVGFERTSEPISLSFGRKGTSTDPTQSSDRLAIAYTGTDNQVNLITLPSSSPGQSYGSKSSFEKSENCAPSVIHEGVRIRVVWQGTDNCLNTLTTHNGVLLTNKVTFSSWKSIDDASPSLCDMGGGSIITFIYKNLGIYLAAQSSGNSWNAPIALGEHADSETTVAITRTVGNNFAISWIGAEKLRRINILNLTFNPTTKQIIRGPKYTLVERSNNGPALAFGRNSEDNVSFLYLAWTGFGKSIDFMRSIDFGQTWENKISFEKSRPDCGPALTVHEESGLICIGWVGTS